MSKLSGTKGPLESLDGSNAAPGGASHEVDSGDPAKVGYTKMAYPSYGPATSATQIAGTQDSIGAMGNDGTSRNSYQIQSDNISAKNPNTPTGNGSAK